MKRLLIPSIVAALAAPTFAQLNDIAPVDMKQVLQGLKQFKEQNETSLNARRNGAYQQIVAAASSNEKAAAFWTNAVTAVRFAGTDDATSAARGWTKGEGEGLKAKEGANAVRLHLVWLGLTLQHVSGAETSKLLPLVIDFTKQLEADDEAIGHVSEKLHKLLEQSPALRHLAGLKPTDNRLEQGLDGAANKRPPTPGAKEALEELRTKQLHDKVLKASVSSGPVAQSLQIVELLGEAGKRKKKGEDSAGWEPVPGNVNGIYDAIILPEFRATKDPRLMDYWDMMLRKNQSSIYVGMPAFEEKQKTQVERPAMMWARTQDMLLIGLRNRAITEMFNLIKAYPQHPDAAGWIGQLEQLLTPAPAPSATILNSGAVPPPAAVPPATAPGNPPTAIIVPGTR